MKRTSSLKWTMNSFQVCICIAFVLVTRHSDFSSTIVVDNIPVVGNDKAPKLKLFLLKIFSAFVNTLQESDIYFPFEENGQKTTG